MWLFPAVYHLLSAMYFASLFRVTRFRKVPKVFIWQGLALATGLSPLRNSLLAFGGTGQTTTKMRRPLFSMQHQHELSYLSDSVLRLLNRNYELADALTDLCFIRRPFPQRILKSNLSGRNCITSLPAVTGKVTPFGTSGPHSSGRRSMRP
jgi:hypothetical protein